MVQSKQTLSFKLINSRTRPFISYYSENREVLALIDTGALTPIWCMGVKSFLKAYPNAIHKSGETCHISGFGQTPIIGKTYIIPRFVLQDTNASYVILNLQVAVCRHPQIGCDFVLSDTMFSKTDMCIIRRGKKRLVLHYDQNSYQCTPLYSGNHFTVTTWGQDGE